MNMMSYKGYMARVITTPKTNSLSGTSPVSTTWSGFMRTPYNET
jgi:hypothetical protein